MKLFSNIKAWIVAGHCPDALVGIHEKFCGRIEGWLVGSGDGRTLAL